MDDQADRWSAVAAEYEQEFVDPYRAGGADPLLEALAALAGEGTAADLGCGVGPLLPVLARQFQQVWAVDFAERMLERARQLCTGLGNVEFLQRNLTDLGALAGQLDVAVAVNSLVLPNLDDLEQALAGIHSALRPGGHFLGIVPAMDAVHYHTMLLIDRARRTGMPQDMARRNAAQHGEHQLFDFTFGTFRYRGLEQHFWQPFEIPYRLKRAGFRRVRRRRVSLAWGQCACGKDLKGLPAPWDWFFHAEA
jgi:SAM-dependent methyltransferase